MERIVELAFQRSVINLGQLNRSALTALEAAVKAGVLVKGCGGPYPTVKAVWAASGYDFAGERAKVLAARKRFGDNGATGQMLRLLRGTEGAIGADAKSCLALGMGSYRRNGFIVRWSKEFCTWDCWQSNGDEIRSFATLSDAFGWTDSNVAIHPPKNEAEARTELFGLRVSDADRNDLAALAGHLRRTKSATVRLLIHTAAQQLGLEAEPIRV